MCNVQPVASISLEPGCCALNGFDTERSRISGTIERREETDQAAVAAGRHDKQEH